MEKFELNFWTIYTNAMLENSIAQTLYLKQIAANCGYFALFGTVAFTIIILLKGCV